MKPKEGWISKKVPIKCCICSKEKYFFPYEVKRGKDKTCSRECFRKYLSKRMIGRKFSDEWLKNMSLCKIGHKMSKETIAKMIKINTGKRRTPEQKLKMSLAHKGKHHHTEEWKENMRKRMRENNPFKGKKLTEEHRKNLSLGQKGRKAWNKGIIYYQIKGEKHPFWKGGITKLEELIRKSVKYSEWRSNIYKRDNFKCINCKSNSNKIQGHHIIAFSKILIKNNIKTLEEAINCKELWDLNNGITLCKDCHRKTDNWGFRLNKENIYKHKKEISESAIKLSSTDEGAVTNIT